MLAEQLDYRRAKDKKRQIAGNLSSFYQLRCTALTRAIRNVYLIESDTQHPLFELLEVKADGPVKVEAEPTSLGLAKEARKLEPGKTRTSRCHPATRFSAKRRRRGRWDQPHTEQLLTKVFRDNALAANTGSPLYEQAVCYDLPVLADFLQEHGKFQAANTFYTQRSPLFAKTTWRIFRQTSTRHSAPMRQTWRGTPAAGNLTR